MEKPVIAVVFGTRPEAVKLAPVIEALRTSDAVETRLVATAQHRELLDQMLAVFDLKPDVDLDLMRPDQTLEDVTAGVVRETAKAFDALRPALVLVQGDTTTVFSAALAAFYRRIPVGHVEAGLRSGERYSPFPEEINRTLAGVLSTLHFAPTIRAAENLQREGIPKEAVFVTGNPVIDAVRLILDRTSPPPFPFLQGDERVVAMTAHRRESFGEPLLRICQAVRAVAEGRDDVHFVYPVHPNPHVFKPVQGSLSSLPNVTLLDPMAYVPFVHLMNRARVLLTDSGGIQEEGCALGKPILVMREVTERPEAVEAGAARLVGTDPRRIERALHDLLDEGETWDRMAKERDVFGDGKAGARIASISMDAVLKGIEPLRKSRDEYGRV
ncbi:MAG: non-hydrolyzing UDP-N-acetylglucosamine 2-epimerase [Planctomycetota bacterium]|jgi:UDP-N-acetylglucosamine 2-epimerase